MWDSNGCLNLRQWWTPTRGALQWRRWWEGDNGRKCDGEGEKVRSQMDGEQGPKQKWWARSQMDGEGEKVRFVRLSAWGKKGFVF